jgi:hypothetical protein
MNPITQLYFESALAIAVGDEFARRGLFIPDPADIFMTAIYEKEYLAMLDNMECLYLLENEGKIKITPDDIYSYFRSVSRQLVDKYLIFIEKN